MKRDFDVIVIGSGVAGAMAAYRLAKLKARALILEAGNHNPSRAEMVGAYATAFPKSLHTPYVQIESDTNAPSPDSSPNYYDTPEGFVKFRSTYERRTGGATWHWLGHTPRMLHSDFKMKSAYGGGPNFPDGFVDWPISYDDLEPWYCEAEAEMGVAGSDAEWQNLFNSPRSKPFPMSMIWPSYSDRWIAEQLDGKEFEGLTYRVHSTPSARNSSLYDNRPPCAGNSICVPLCPIGAKYDGAVHVAKAVENGAVLWEQAVVTRLEKDKDASVHRVEFVTYGDINRKNRTASPVTAEVVIIAANAIETPKLLLISELADKSGKVGFYLMDHLSKSTFGKASEPLFPFRGPPSTSGIESFRDGEFRREYAGFRLSLNNDGWGRKGSPYADIVDLVTNERRIGTDLQQALFDRVVRQLRLSCSVEVAPDSANRVELSSMKDALGILRPKVTFAAPQYSLKGLAHATSTMKNMFEILGEKNPDLGQEGAFDGAGHIMGTCRMGGDATTSVVDADCCSHDHHNLFILGSAVFPTCGSPNPTLTLAALALRGADHIARRMGLKTAQVVQE